MLRIIKSVWALVVSCSLLYFIFFPSATRFIVEFFNGTEALVLTLLMLVRGFVVVELVGYLYHRFFQHLGVMTRAMHFIRRNQRFHWIHHMIYYPIGSSYKRKGDYNIAEKGFPLSWFIPGLILAPLIFWAMGINVYTFVFISTFTGYGIIISKIHSSFHVTDHFLTRFAYYNYLEDVHVLHHWDQAYNFTILFPFMDMIFGTYMSPSEYQRELKLSLKDTVSESDIINWTYLLKYATPAEYAAYISAARKFPGSLKKVREILQILKKKDKDLYKRGLDCLHEIDIKESKHILHALGVK